MHVCNIADLYVKAFKIFSNFYYPILSLFYYCNIPRALKKRMKK